MSGTFILEREQLLPLPRPQVFAFFARPENFGRITPPYLRFRILTPCPVPMAEGAIIDYQIRLFSVPLRWRTLIEAYEPERRFVDVQLRGPYALWRHAHTFEERVGGTLVADRVEYSLPLGPLGRMAHALWVRRTLEAIFEYRKAAAAEIFARP